MTKRPYIPLIGITVAAAAVAYIASCGPCSPKDVINNRVQPVVVADERGLTGAPIALLGEASDPFLIYSRQNWTGEIRYRRLNIGSDGRISSASDPKQLIDQRVPITSLGGTSDGRLIVYGGSLPNGDYSVRVLDVIADGDTLTTKPPREAGLLPKSMGYTIIGFLNEKKMSKLEERIATSPKPFTGFPLEELQQQKIRWDLGNSWIQIARKGNTVVGFSPKPGTNLDELVEKETGAIVLAPGRYFPVRIRGASK